MSLPGKMRVLAGLLLAAGVSLAWGEELSGFDCLIEPYAVADVSTREQGILEAFLVDRGDLVTRGQVVARLDSSIEEASVALAEAKARMRSETQERRTVLSYLQREQERLEKLHQNKAASLHDMDKAETEQERAVLRLRQAVEEEQLAKLELERARKILERRTIHSPIDGTVVDTVLTPGESVENRTILQIAQIDPLKVEVIIPVAHYGAITVGMQAEVVPKYPGATAHMATVSVVDRVVDAASNTFGVRLDLANSDFQIPGGVRCDIRFLGPEAQQ